MLNYLDEKRIREIVKEETHDIRKTVNHTSVNVDKILKMFVDLKQEHTIAKAKVDKHETRLRRVEKKLKITPPSASVAFA